MYKLELMSFIVVGSYACIRWNIRCEIHILSSSSLQQLPKKKFGGGVLIQDLMIAVAKATYYQAWWIVCQNPLTTPYY